MAKFIINENFSDAIEVEAEKYGINDGFMHFSEDGTRVFSIATGRVVTVRREAD
jgi:hypothetical protein